MSKQIVACALAVLFTAAMAGCANLQAGEIKNIKKGETMKTNEIVLTDANFDAETGKGVVLIDFWAPWCAPCLMQGPIIEKVAATMAGKAKIGKCNVDEAPQVSERFGIRSIPTLIILKDGKVVEQFVGVRREAELISALTKHIK